MFNRKLKIRVIAVLFLLLSAVLLFKVIRAVLVFEEQTSHQQLPTIGEGVKNTISDVVYKTYKDGVNDLSLQSTRVNDLGNSELDLKNLAATFQISKDEIGTIYADHTKALTKDSKQCEFSGNVMLSTENGLQLRSEKSFVDFDKKIALGDTPITITQDDMKISSQEYHFDMDKQVVTLKKQVNGTVGRADIQSDHLIAEFGKSKDGDLKKLHATGNSMYKTEKYTLRANRNIDYTPSEINAVGNVRLNYRSNGKTYDIKADTMDGALKNGILKKMTADGSLKIVSPDATEIYGNHGIFENDILTVTGKVIISNAKGKIMCTEAELDTKTDAVHIRKSRGVVTAPNKKSERRKNG